MVEVALVPGAPRGSAGVCRRSWRPGRGALDGAGGVTSGGTKPLAPSGADRREGMLRMARQDPEVQEVLAAFPDARDPRGQGDGRGGGRWASERCDEPGPMADRRRGRRDEELRRDDEAGQQMQAKMPEMQARSKRRRSRAAAGGGWWWCTLNGKGDMAEIEFDPSLLKAGEAEILEDLIVAAHADAKAKVDVIADNPEADKEARRPLGRALHHRERHRRRRARNCRRPGGQARRRTFYRIDRGLRPRTGGAIRWGLLRLRNEQIAWGWGLPCRA